ncbi:hypothetical protein [Planococcus donghaensis]|uniref:Uncharacterized protein n=1 Tax=Planococcus donghaensis TaxID=414778 RepID=A0A1C7EE68_9BACL|nr:hypothetical protein [Planococcus donghaensis]ANU21976.1 hypothetical protein BCM40_00885 [Planococcus donghaensis]
MGDYRNTKEELLQKVTLTEIRGIPLQKEPYKGWFPIRPFPNCICVTEPCPCDKLEDIIIWLPTGTKQEGTGKRHGDAEILSYQVDKDLKILVEPLVPITVGRLQDMQDLTNNDQGKVTTMYKKSGKSSGKPSVGGLLIGAFELGWAIGTKIDEETDLSDKIADWLDDLF